MAGKRRQIKLIATIAALAALMPAPVWAAITIVPECARVKATYGQAVPVPQLSCMMEMFGNIALLILGITGSLALLMFVYGGFMIILSGGEAGRVIKGKTIIRNAVIGILIIMTSGVILQYGLQKIGISNKFKIIGQTCGSNKVFVQMPDGSIDCQTIKATE